MNCCSRDLLFCAVLRHKWAASALVPDMINLDGVMRGRGSMRCFEEFETDNPNLKALDLSLIHI